MTNSIVSAAGAFTTIGGQPRNRLAAIASGTGLATSWNPNADDIVYSMAINGSTMYVGGGFTIMGVSGRSRVAALDVTSGATTAWNPSADGPVYSIAATGSRVYLGGEFLEVGGLPQSGLASIFPNITAVEETPTAVESVLGPPSPNPFFSSTSIRLSLARQETVTLRVFDVHGREVAVLADGNYSAGTHVFGWNGKSKSGESSASGVYFCELETSTAYIKRKMVLAR